MTILRRRYTVRDAVKLSDHVLVYEIANGGIVATSVANLIKFVQGSASNSETDPVFLASPAGGISAGHVSNWHAAYGWGNHASPGYLLPSTIGVTVQGYSANLAGWSAVATSAKQNTLVSGTTIKTINGNSVLGSGDITVAGSPGALNDLTDVAVTTPTTGQVIKYNGTTWVNAADEGGSGAVASVNGQTGVVVLDSEDVGSLPAASADLITATKTTPVDADQLIMLDSAAAGAPVLVTKANLLAEVNGQLAGVETLMAAL